MSYELKELTPVKLASELSQASTVEQALERVRAILWGVNPPDILALHTPHRVIALTQSTVQALPIDYSAKGTASLQGTAVNESLFLADVAETTSPHSGLATIRGVRSLALVPVGKKHPIVFEATFYNRYHRFRTEERILIESAAVVLASVLSPKDIEDSPHDLSTGVRAIALSFSSDFHLKQVRGPVERLLGVQPEKLIADPQWWRSLVHPTDLKRLILRTSQKPQREITEEIRITKAQTNSTLWFLLNIAPRFDQNGVLLDWEGFALDVSEKYIAKVELLSERRRLEALYAVSRALEHGNDPAVVALNGLYALMRATLSDGGIVFLMNEQYNELEIVASHGLTQPHLESLRELSIERGLVGAVVTSRKAELFHDVQHDPRTEAALLGTYGPLSAILAPLVFENELLGLVLLYGKRTNRYAQADVEVVEATANQLALAARQAELYLAERTQAESLAALYRLSHELSKQVTLSDVINTAFPIIREELACKRLWLGTMNEQQTLLLGQSALGPGMRRALGQLRIELRSAPQLLKNAIVERKTTVIPNARAQACGEIDRLFEKLQVGTLAVVPLVSLGQLIGILVVEPQVSTGFFSEQRIKLLEGMGNELATIILARRYEAKMADTAKMQMASLLASGVAHNFNNLLQVIMGQASLIQLQAGESSKIGGVAQGILDSASRGAELVRQLYTFSSAESFNPQVSSVNQALVELKGTFQEILGPDVSLEYKLPAQLDAAIDLAMLRQIVINLLSNAREALRQSPIKQVKISATDLELHAGDIDPNLQSGNYVRIDIEDTGRGMSEEEQKRCFEPFFSTKNTDPRSGLSLTGAGLGLSAAYLIMKQHRGHISLRSEVGLGTTFSLYFPKGSSLSKEKLLQSQASF